MQKQFFKNATKIGSVKPISFSKYSKTVMKFAFHFQTITFYIYNLLLKVHFEPQRSP